MTWPLYFSDNIHLSNPSSEIGILCLWTKKERAIEKINPKSYSFIGQLYSKDYGIMILIRNLLAKNDLRELVLIGIDLNNTKKVIKSLFEKGIDNNRKIIGTEIYLDDEIKKEHIQLLQSRIQLTDLTSKKLDELNKFLKTKNKGPKGEIIKLPLPHIPPPKKLPTDFSGFKARGLNFTSAYKKLITYILKFGEFSEKEKKLKAWNTTLFAKDVTENDKQFLGKPINKKIKPTSHKSNKNFESSFFENLDAWTTLQEIAKNHTKNNSLNIISFETFIHEKDLEAAYELIGSIPDTHTWDQDPHGSLIIRVEEGLIRITHLDASGKIIDEFHADNAKTLYKKIVTNNKISLLYHALDIGGEIKLAEQALIKGKKYIQDKNY